MKTAVPHRSSAQLICAVIACALVLGLLCGGRIFAIHLEEKTIHTTAPQDFWIKNQGLALQRVAARTPDILLLYGSSELIDPIPNRASDFFATAPTGFEVCPIGKPGATSLVILQRLGALGSDLRGRKVAVSISPSFFFRHDLNTDSYAGNFSVEAASALLFSSTLDADLKRDIARRMLQFPETLGKSAVLKLAAQEIAYPSAFHDIVTAAIWPLAELQNVTLDLQDHFETLVFLLAGGRGISHRTLHGLMHGQLGADDENQGVKLEKGVGLIAHHGEAAFRERVQSAAEWTDLELMFRTLREIGTRPLVLSLPLNGSYYDAAGISRSARQVYYDKLRDLATRYGIDLIEFEDHDTDPDFQITRREHPTSYGWKFYDQALDEFFHDRVANREGGS